MKKGKVLLVLTTALALGTVGITASAAYYSEWTGRGTWNYGNDAWFFQAYSEYKVDDINHGSQVVNANNGASDTANQRAGAWSHAKIYDIWDPATFYYRNGTYNGASWK